jgi:sugar lactone lactonase YvrE
MKKSLYQNWLLNLKIYAILITVTPFYINAQNVSTLAGSGASGSTNATGTSASFNKPQGVVVDANGNVYVSEYSGNKIRKITPEGVVTTFAGSSSAGTSNGTGTAARFSRPNGLAIDASRNIYVADEWNHRIRKITPVGVVTTFAGSSSGSNNGTGTAAQFNKPSGVAVDGSGNLFVCDRSNHLIRKITSAGVVTTFAGSGSSGNSNGTGTAATFANPTGIAIDANDNLYITDYSNHSVRKITSAGVVTTLAGPVGSTGTWGTTNATGTSARFNYPYHIVINSHGNIIVSELNGQRLRKITTAGVVTSYVGSTTSGSTNAVGTSARFSSPRGLGIDTDDNIFIADYNNHLVRKVYPYSYGKKITIDNTKVAGSSSLTDFPVLISLTDIDLRSTSNSGNVHSSNGYDITFKNNTGTTVLSHEIEKYDPTTGELIAWVKVPSLSATTDTEINMYYGNPCISSDPSSSSTWNSDYIVDMHMDDNPTGTISNSSQQNFTASSFGSMTSGDILTGKIGNGTDFDGSNDGFTMSDNNSLDLNTNDFTFSCWFKTDAVSNYQTLFNKKPSGGGVTGFGAVYVNPNSQLTFYFKGAGTTQGGGTTTATVNANSWYSFHLTCDVANDEVEIYLNGSLVSTISVDAGSTLANGHHQYFGSFNTSSYPFNGVLDEMRIALTDFSADWIATEYNNQNSPSTFYSVSSQQNATNPLPVDLISFLVIPTTNHTAQLNWMTASEINNSHFEIERSYDGRDFEMIDQVSGNGNSQHQIEYSYLDENISPMENTVFYRLKQLDFDGAFEYSDIRVVRFDALENDMQLEAYPNPFSDEVTLLVGLSQGENYSLEITDLKGRLMHQSKHTFKRGVHSLNLSKWDKGVYFAEVISEYGSEYLKIIKK